MSESKEVKVDQIEVGKTYDLKGMIHNGHTKNAEGNVIPFTCSEHVSRKIIAVRNNKIYCECGREFIADQTKVMKVPYETYNEKGGN